MNSAIDFLKAGNWNEGLKRLNAIWSEHHCTGFAEQIERLSRHARDALPPLEGKGKALQSAWEKRAVTPSLLGVEHLLGVIRSGTVKQLRLRFDRLRERKPDPRMTMVVPLFASELHLRSQPARSVWTAFFKLVIHTGDPRARRTLESLAKMAQTQIDKLGSEVFEEYLVKQIPKVLDKLPKPGNHPQLTQLEKEVDALVAQPFELAEESASETGRLYSLVLETPSDLDTIQVWADALSDEDDDRGAFVLLQTMAESQELTTIQKKTEAKLLKANRLTWLGQAGAFVDAKTATFRRGLPDSVILKDKTITSDLEAPEFRSVTQVWASSWSLLAHDNLISLTGLGSQVVPNPRSTTGLVGFDLREMPQYWQYDRLLEIGKLGLKKITLLEISLPRDLDLSELTRCFPDLDTVVLSYGWVTERDSFLDPLLPWLQDIKHVILDGTSSPEWLIDELPSSNVHAIGRALHKSYLRRNGELELVITAAPNKLPHFRATPTVALGTAPCGLLVVPTTSGVACKARGPHCYQHKQDRKGDIAQGEIT